MHRSFGQGPASKEAAKPVPPHRPGQSKGSKMANKAKDNWRKWMWMFLGVIAALQLYFGFAGIAVCLASLYLAQKGWESGVARLAASQNSWVLAARRATAVSEEWVRRPLRRPDSEPAH